MLVLEFCHETFCPSDVELQSLEPLAMPQDLAHVADRKTGIATDAVKFTGWAPTVKVDIGKYLCDGIRKVDMEGNRHVTEIQIAIL